MRKVLRAVCRIPEAIKCSVYTEYIRIHSGVSASSVKNFSINPMIFSQRNFRLLQAELNFSIYVRHRDLI